MNHKNPLQCITVGYMVAEDIITPNIFISECHYYKLRGFKYYNTIFNTNWQLQVFISRLRYMFFTLKCKVEAYTHDRGYTLFKDLPTQIGHPPFKNFF